MPRIERTDDESFPETMQNKQPKLKPSVPNEEQRRRAEALLRERHPRTGHETSEPDPKRLVHELQVHEIELEMQNEELQKARELSEAGLEKYSDLYEFAPVGYMTFDRGGTVLEANLFAVGLLGLDRSKVLKRRFHCYVAPPELAAFNAFLARVFETRIKEACELTLLNQNQSSIPVRLEATIAASGRECRVVMMDLTQRKQAEEARLILSKLESTGILAGGIAHDFNNLLTVILLDVELALAATHTDEGIARYLKDAKKTVLMARGLTQQLITFADGGSPIPKPLHLAELIRQSVRTALSGSCVQCEFHLAKNLWLIEADESQIGQVFCNLALNAREAMPDGGLLSVRASNQVLASQGDDSLPAGDYVQVSIADQGGGMAEGLTAKIFDPYFSTKCRGTQKGMGLGLTICQTVMQKHGGSIVVETKEGVGTTFYLYFSASRNMPCETRPLVPPIPLRPARILVMDDEEGVREVMRLLLEQMGNEVEVVTEGALAVEAYQAAKAQELPFDVVILDLTVRAGMGGQEAMRALLRIDPSVRAIVMSGYADDPVISQPEGYGFLGVLAKPFTSENLRTALARVMESEHVK
jgi:two-component system, cell cycle sensor histidine kinase and response regulator CckA